MKDMLPEENGSFIWKGQVGDWMNHFKDPDRLREFDQWIDENNKNGIPIRYKLWKWLSKYRNNLPSLQNGREDKEK